MSVIRLGGFRGELPRVHPRFLPEGNAQSATNCRFDSVALEAIKDVSYLKDTTLTNPISLHRYSANVWLEALFDFDWVPYPVTNDIYDRLIFIDPDQDELRVTDGTLVGDGLTQTGNDNIANSYLLKVPAPTQGFAATLSGTADDEDEVPETRYYVCTFVNSWGAEGPPSPPSNQVEWRTGQIVTLTGLPSTPPGAYNFTHRRIYRINTGASGATNYQFLTEVALLQSTKSVTSATQANPVVITTDVPHNFTNGQEVKFTNFGTAATTVITNVSRANPCRVTSPGHGLNTGFTVEIKGLGDGNGMDELDGIRNVVTVVDSDRFDLDGIDSSAYTPWVTGGTAARVYGMDELDIQQHIVSVIDLTSFALESVDGTGFYPYIGGGSVAQVYGVTYIDTLPSGSLGEVLPTELYDPPNSATEGIRAHPAGFLVGFFGNTLCFSEFGAPHAWPIDYRLATNHDIVGLGIFGNTIAVVTKGWPYLVVGSDPSALSMVELEIEQACVGRRSIVDFGTSIVYASPDGLILVDGSGATNLTASIWTRDQFQALVPSSFDAFNWEQQYLCFYDDGTVQQAFIVNPYSPEEGVRYINKYATGGYKDIEEDLLYLIIDDKIQKWDQSSTKLSYTWKSKPTYAVRPVNMSAAKVIADNYPVTVAFFVDDVKRYTRVVGSGSPFRLPAGFKGEKFEVTITGTNRVSEFIMATTMTELSLTV